MTEMLTMTEMLMREVPAIYQSMSIWLELLVSQSLNAGLLFVPVALLTLWRGRRWVHLLHGLWWVLLLRLMTPPFLTASWALPWPTWASTGPVGSAASEGSIGAVASIESFASSSPLEFTGLLFGLWCLGALASAWVYRRRSRVFERILKRAIPLEDPRWTARMDFWRRRFKVRRRVLLLTSPDTDSEEVSSPFTVGCLRPKIYLPPKLLRAAPESIDAAVAHELAHIKRWDYLWIRLQGWIQVVYFFNPLVWIAAGRLHRLREALCDQMVLADGTISRRSYGAGLLAVLSIQPPARKARLTAIPTFSCDRAQRTQRMEDILFSRLPSRSTRISAIGIALIVAAWFLPMPVHEPMVLAEESITVRNVPEGPCAGAEPSEAAWRLTPLPWELPTRSDLQKTPTCPCGPVPYDA